MDGEQRRHARASPDVPCHPAEEQEERERVYRMEHHADHVVGSWTHTEQLDVEHVGHPGDGVPVPHSGIDSRHRPDETRRGEATGDMLVLDHIGRVVQAHEVVMPDLGEDRHDQCRQCQSQKSLQPLLRHTVLPPVTRTPESTPVLNRRRHSAARKP